MNFSIKNRQQILAEPYSYHDLKKEIFSSEAKKKFVSLKSN
jgi:hypothetical protein